MTYEITMFDVEVEHACTRFAGRIHLEIIVALSRERAGMKLSDVKVEYEYRGHGRGRYHVHFEGYKAWFEGDRFDRFENPAWEYAGSFLEEYDRVKASDPVTLPDNWTCRLTRNAKPSSRG